MKTQLLLLCLTGLLLKSPAQESYIDKKNLKEFVKVLTSDSLEGRGTGSDGQQKAAKYISERFEALGLQTYRGSYLEKFNLLEVYRGEAYIETSGIRLDNFDEMVLQGHMALNGEVEKEMVFGGSGTDEELDQIDVTDRFVLVLGRHLRAPYEISRRLEARNAFGLIMANPENDQQFESIKRTLRDFYLGKRYALEEEAVDRDKSGIPDTFRFVHSILIPNNRLNEVSGLSEKELISLMEQNRIREAPIASIKAKFEKVRQIQETANVVGLIKGKRPETIVISAHYDHLGKIENDLYPGADDNASGTAALMELAEEFSYATDLDYNLLFLATSAEEAGLLGSSYHVNNPDFDPTKIVCNLNLDMISRTDEKHSRGDYLYCIGTDQSPALDQLIKKADALFDKCSFDYSENNSKDPLGIYTRSDNYSFHKKGIPAVFFFAGLHADYHKTTDTMEKINFRNLEDRVKQISTVIRVLQTEGMKD